MYNTKQREYLLDLFKTNEDKEFTIDDIKCEINKDSQRVSQATIYRNLECLLTENKIKKYLIDNKAFYKYSLDKDCNHHCHLICNECKEVIHLSCNEVKHFSNHIYKNHSFEVDPSKIVFYGICSKCKEKKQ